MADEVVDAVEIHVLEIAQRTFFAPKANVQSAKRERILVDVGHIEGATSEDRHRNDSMTVQIDAIRIAAGFDVDVYRDLSGVGNAERRNERIVSKVQAQRLRGVC